MRACIKVMLCFCGYVIVGLHLNFGETTEPCKCETRTNLRASSHALQSAMDLWLYAHGNFCTKVHGMEKLMSKHASRYLLEHLQSWRGLVEYYFQREILLQQNAIRRAYALASRFLN